MIITANNNPNRRPQRERASWARACPRCGSPRERTSSSCRLADPPAAARTTPSTTTDHHHQHHHHNHHHHHHHSLSPYHTRTHSYTSTLSLPCTNSNTHIRPTSTTTRRKSSEGRDAEVLGRH